LEPRTGALARARQSPSLQLVTVVGVPGIGKSRLVLELLGVVDADPDLITWRQGRCLPYGDGVAFLAVGEMVKAQADVLDTDSVDEASTTSSSGRRASRCSWSRRHGRNCWSGAPPGAAAS